MANSGNDKSLPSRRQVIAGLTAGAAVVGTTRVSAEQTPEIARNAEAIHQEVAFKAPRHRVYAVLTNAHEFQQVVALSGAVQSGKVKQTIPAQIGRQAGSPFSIFGGFVGGRNIEMIPDTRVVQAWRPQDWPPGVYSIVKFELVERGAETLLVFDHTGFPAGQADSLAAGWRLNYWQPMAQVLAK
jgi:activator of HSP90 ATPase